MTQGSFDKENNYSIINNIKSRGFGDIHIYHCNKTQLTAIIAIHSTKLGPAIGGCRCLEYTDFNSAIEDAMKLGRAMSYKAAIHDLPHGGGKSVLIKPKNISNRQEYFHKFADFVNQQCGRYITSVDSGTSTSDMNFVLEKTEYVLGYNRQEEHYSNDPSVLTAKGVKHAISAAVSHKMGRDLSGVTVAIQGAGNVGSNLCKLLLKAGAKVKVADIDQSKVTALVEKFQVEAVSNTDILNTECDVLAPCALGGIINNDTINKLKCKIICGAANNQLADPILSESLHKMGILYIPDYLANGGGLIFVASNYVDDSDAVMLGKIDAMHERVKNILSIANSEQNTPLKVCERIALENIER
ncbi:MAG: Glu/Leu/Phe/Val dehydrogenase [Legionellales bacterium]|jgi:leucine dehydrogenase|nr:Glu/Leu/Phe/Val dehydrogenase [Legionellales bacterium]